MREIEAIKAELEIAEERYHTLRKELREAREAAAPVHVGDIVRWADSSWRKNKYEPVQIESLVTRVDVSWGSGHCGLQGRRRNKDGSWSKAVTHIYSRGEAEVIGHEDLEPNDA